MSSQDELIRRLELLELNQRRLAILTLPAPEEHKAFDRACLRHNLTFEQEAESRAAIVDALRDPDSTLNTMTKNVADIVGHIAIASDLIEAFRLRGTAAERWKELSADCA
ncbi:hypothetical protein QVA66_00595 [Staphylococcus chromogenes]|nr:hypothetical protein [Staphylococcus chromogenes]